MKALANIFRILCGATFVFSGFVKGIDPLGFAYRLEDYFIAFHWPAFMPFALALTVLLVTFEFTVGVMLLLNLRIKFAAWLLLITMVFFTGLTLNDAINNPVPDCGCFGDAIKLTNWQTFYKNIMLLALAIVVFAYRKKFKPAFGGKLQWIITLVAAAAFAAFSLWNYRHLPIIDFTEWKVGHKLYSENPQPVKYYLTYKNKSTGEKKEYLSPDYPYADSAWMNNWEFVSQRVEDPNVYFGKSLIITDTTGNDNTMSIIRNPGYQLVVNSYDLREANADAFRAIEEISKQVSADSISIAVLVSSQAEEIRDFVSKNKLSLSFYQADDILLKTMVRSNPGLMLLKAGVVIRKWNCNDFPNAGELLQIMRTNDSK